jgi:uroporphyrinogen decarboxylase
MNSRERLETSLNHKEPDQVPIDLGGIVTGITTGANESVKSLLGIESNDPVVDRVQQLANPSDAVLERLDVDTRYIYLQASRDWQDIELPDDTYQDEFGVIRKAAYNPDGWLLYYDHAGHPLGDAETVTDLAKFKWPDPHDAARYEGIEEAARKMSEETDYAVMANVIASIFEFSWYLRGYMRFFEDVILNPEMISALLEMMGEYQRALMGEVLDRIGPYISVVMTGSDLGTQRAPVLSPEAYMKLVWPEYKKLWDLIKSKTDAKIFYHSCGSLFPMIPFLIEGGVDILHPVQPLAAEMGDRERLKNEFGEQLTFWGGFDQQHILPHGTPEEVREETKKLLDAFMPGGGFVFAAGHNIQIDVPPENVITLFDTVREYGVY